MLAALAVAAFLVAWTVNALMSLMMGEKSQDTRSLWFDIFFRFFAILELGVIGRMLSYLGFSGWPRKAVVFIGALCVLLFLIKACSTARHRDPYLRTYTYTNGQWHEVTNH